MYDSERDSFMIALKALGYSMNTTNESEIEEAYQWLIDQRDTMDPIWTTLHRNREPTDGMMQWLSQRTAAKYSLPMNLLIL